MFQAPSAWPVHIEDDRIMRNPANDSCNKPFILDKLRPSGKLIVSSVKSARGFIAGAYYLKQEAGRGGIIWQVSDFILEQVKYYAKLGVITSKTLVLTNLELRIIFDLDYAF